MDYRKHYRALISRARERQLSGYVERHHVIPKCIGGRDLPENVVILTAEEHFLAHLLLVKMYPRHDGLLSAVMLMSGTQGDGKRRNNKAYGWVRRLVSERKKLKTHSAEARAKISKVHKGRKRDVAWIERMKRVHTGRKRPDGTGEKISAALKAVCASPEHRKKMSEICTGRKFSDEFRQKCRKNRTGTTLSASTKAKLSAAMTGRTLSPETIARMRVAASLREAKKRAKANDAKPEATAAE